MLCKYCTDSSLALDKSARVGNLVGGMSSTSLFLLIPAKENLYEKINPDRYLHHSCIVPAEYNKLLFG
ncbi:hypothetical protein BBD40_22835 [Paenibacillus ihbetae]|uniref:Uncharacterized protein n=1 Tax=Paenibacillus ihbetae TaxID=1870820 RepID=A0ABX3JNW7_9BACL|nr:hypothetical protein BBD40_22835 [Paenibacillus ihbetae]